MIGTKKAAAMMCRLKPSVGGHIINWSSMGAIATVSGVAIYQATKYDRTTRRSALTYKLNHMHALLPKLALSHTNITPCFPT